MGSAFRATLVTLLFLLPSLSFAATRSYHHLDHLGSQSVSTYGNGTPQAIRDYTPDGRVRLENTIDGSADQRAFGGHVLDDTSLLYLGARYYQADTSRFLSVDPAARDNPSQFLDDPQQLHLYAYARNNPVRFVDEHGEAAKDFQRRSPTVPVLLADGAPVVDRGREAFTFRGGEAMGYYKGVGVLSNGTDTGSGGGSLRQQCVGFVKEFYRATYGVEIGRVGDAHGLMSPDRLQHVTTDRLAARHFVEYRSGATNQPPRDDDILGWHGGEHGHVAIVAAVQFDNRRNQGYIDVVEQNWGRGSIGQSAVSRHELRRDPSTGTYSVADRGGYRAHAWYRLQSSTHEKK